MARFHAPGTVLNVETEIEKTAAKFGMRIPRPRQTFLIGYKHASDSWKFGTHEFTVLLHRTKSNIYYLIELGKGGLFYSLKDSEVT
jgi:hypothetical protein